MNWKTGEAKQHFSALLRAARQEPQAVFHRDRLVAAVIDAETFQEFETWRETVKGADLAQATAELRRLVAEEGELEIPQREDRANSFLEALADEPNL